MFFFDYLDEGNWWLYFSSNHLKLIYIEKNPQQSEAQNTFDSLERKQYQRISSGPIHMVLYAVKFSPSTTEAHKIDLFPLLIFQVKNGKGIAFLKVNNRPDCNLLTVVNSLYFCRLERDSELDLLRICSYGACYCAYNKTEHNWSLMSRTLASNILPSLLEGDIVPLYRQTNLSLDEIREKEAQVIFLLTC